MVLLISSIKLAAKKQSILRSAAIALNTSNDITSLEKNLDEIIKSADVKMLGPIEKAEIVQLLAFRKMPQELFSPSLKSVEILSTITQADIKKITIFIADFFLTLSIKSEKEAKTRLDMLYNLHSAPQKYYKQFEE